MKAAHRTVVEVPFEVTALEKGYANRGLRIDLTQNEIRVFPVTQSMKDLWVGGKGLDLWLMFQEVGKETRWDSPENPICFSPGPLAGTTSFPGSGKTLVTSLSPMTGSVVDCNVGGYFGPLFKFCGLDALVVVGKAPEETIVVIDAVRGRITIERAPLESIDAHLLAEELTEMYADDGLDKRNISVVCAGRGAQYTRMGVLNFSFYDWRKKTARIKQAGRGGIGRVFRDKGLKALVVHGFKLKSDMNRAAQVERTSKVGRRLAKEIHDFDDQQNKMRKIGTAHLVEIMDAYDLLPVWNFQYGNHPDTHKIASPVWEARFTQGIFDGCCTAATWRARRARTATR